MLKVKIIAGLVGEDGESWLPGEIHEASERFARWLLHRGVAAAVDDMPAAPRLTSQIFNAPQPAVEHRDPVKAKGRK